MPGSVNSLVGGYLGFSVVKFVGYSIYGWWLEQRYARKPRYVEIDSEDRINEDVKCGLCGYNLRTLNREGRCPECGGEISATIKRLRLPERKLSQHPFVVGLLRTLIGIAVGTLYWHILSPGLRINPGLLVIEVGLLPLRILEWGLLILVIFDPKLELKELDWRSIIEGTLVSYVLDIPAISGICATGGVSIC